MVKDLFERVSRLTLDLRPPMLDDLGLLPTLVWHFNRYTALTSIEVQFQHTGLEKRRFAPQVETAAYRIIQEALTNVARHASADQVEVRLAVEPGMLAISLRDNGQGFDSQSILAEGKGGGLVGMRERAELLGGTLAAPDRAGPGHAAGRLFAAGRAAGREIRGSRMTTVLLADDHNIVRQALRLLLEATTEYQVVGEAADGQQALQLVEELQPDVLVADIMMPAMTGLEVARRVRTLAPHTRVVILSMYDTEAYVAEALQAGVSGFVLKKSTSSDLLQALRQVQEDRLYLSPPLDEAAVHSFIERARENPDRSIRHADRARARGPAPDSPGNDLRRDRRAPVDQPPYGRDAPRQLHAQAASQKPHRAGPFCHPARSGRIGPVTIRRQILVLAISSRIGYTDR